MIEVSCEHICNFSPADLPLKTRRDHFSSFDSYITSTVFTRLKHLTTGTIHVLDLRVGVMMHAFRPHQQDVTNIICGDSGDVFTSSNDTNVSVCHWKRARTFTEGHQPDYSKFKATISPSVPILS